MNCKPGDLVRYIGKAPRPNVYGWIGRVIKQSQNNVGAWVVDPPLPGGHRLDRGITKLPYEVYDYALRPIRDNPGKDETLTWKDVPKTDRLKRELENQK